MDTDEILYTVSEAVRMSREIQDQLRDKNKGAESKASAIGDKGYRTFGSGACLLDSSLLRDMLLSPSEAICAFLTITLHLKRAHGLPGPSSLDEMAQSVCKRIQAACGNGANGTHGHSSAVGSSSKATHDYMLETLALQIAHWEKKREYKDKLASKRKGRANMIFTLQEEITKTKLNTQDTLASNAVCAKVYDLMVDFTIQAADLYNLERRGVLEESLAELEEYEAEERIRDLEQKIRQEVRSALESVFPLYSVRSFCLDIYDNKVKQLGELTRLVVGILCFNCFTGKSTSFTDYNKSLSPSKKTLVASQRGAWQVVVMLKHLALIASNGMKAWKKECRPSPSPSQSQSSEEEEKKRREEGKHRVADLIALAEQSMCICMEQGLQWNALGVDSAENSDRMSMHLAQLKHLVEGKQAVSKDAVYPLFDSIGRLYFEGLDFEYREEATHESAFMKQLISKDGEDGDGVTEGDLAVFMQPPFIRRLKHAESSAGLSDPDLLELDDDLEEEGENEEDLDSNVKDVLPQWPNPLTKTPGANSGNFKDSSTNGHGVSTSERDYDVFEYGGYCPVSIVEDQVLRRGLPNNGVCVLGPSYSSRQKEGSGEDGAAAVAPDRWYAFASKRYKKKFLKTPGRYTAQVTLECVTRLPQLIGLLKLTPERATVDYTCQLVNASEKTKEYGCQTPTHYVEKFVDPHYEWNEWALRRRALQMANLRQKQTHGGQTDKSHFRREMETQVYLPKDSDTQTTIGASQGMPRKVRHITGLRGDAKTKMQLVEASFDLEKGTNARKVTTSTKDQAVG